ncbi:MAG TPA: AraC family transcriptional regulator [Leeuwenhoekiella sp.]|nr:AraC family transcriptional regulator [Leeuwenhoekiella sp.]
MDKNKIQTIKSISEFHRLRGLPPPEHPLISVIDYAAMDFTENYNGINWVLGFYSIALKRNVNLKLTYGQQSYDFDDGVMYFLSPGQVLNVEIGPGTSIDPSGWILLIHPDFLWDTALTKSIKHYEYFDYSVNEALFLSPKEETIMNGIIQNIQTEYNSNIDKFSKQIIISQMETLLNYSDRFYNRQFITREKSNHQILGRLEKLLTDYFNSEDLFSKGLPTVHSVAAQLNVSPSYLGSLLRLLTNQSTQQHIHNKLLEKAKEKLSTTELSVSEIAYELGFEHSQSFSKLFKSKTHQSPLKFRHSFN